MPLRSPNISSNVLFGKDGRGRKTKGEYEKFGEVYALLGKWGSMEKENLSCKILKF